MAQDSQPHYLDCTLKIFQQYNHPFIVIGEHAMRWYGLRVASFDASGRALFEVDILVRASDHDDIVLDLILSGEWKFSTLDRYVPGAPYYQPSPGETVLKHLHPSNEDFADMRLFTQELYCLSVDDLPTLTIPNMKHQNVTLLEEEYHPDPQYYRYGPPTLSRPGGGVQPIKCPAKSDGLYFIPTLQAHLNALLDQIRRYSGDPAKKAVYSEAMWNTWNLIRYLFLELPHQREKILDKVHEQNCELMEKRLNGYTRKLNVGVDGKRMKFYTIIPWETPIPGR